MSIKYKHIWSPKVVQALASLIKQKMAFKDSVELLKFCKKVDEERKIITEALKPLAEKMKTDKETEKEIVEFFETDTSLPKISCTVFDQVENISADELIALDPLLEKSLAE